MSQSIPVELFRSELLTLLEETFEQVQGIFLDRGTSLFETLEPITSDQASRPVSASCASLAAQVKHVAFYLDVLEQYLLGTHTGPDDWGEIWRTTREVTPDQWDQIRQQLRDTYQRVLALLRTLDNWEIHDRVGGAMAIVAHSAYHLGEIRQALCTIA